MKEFLEVDLVFCFLCAIIVVGILAFAGLFDAD